MDGNIPSLQKYLDFRQESVRAWKFHKSVLFLC